MRKGSLSVLLCMLAGCATTEPPPTRTVVEAQTARTSDAPPPAKTARPDDKWKARTVDNDCTAGLTALASAKLDSFHGLGRCGRVDAEFAFGSSGDAPSKFEQFGEYRVYPHAGGSILVWFLAEDIRVLQTLYPKLEKPLKALIGEPEAKVRSQLSEDWDQWVYATRGLTAHVKRGSDEVIALFAYRPTTVDAFLKTDIARVAKSEAPLEELK